MNEVKHGDILHVTATSFKTAHRLASWRNMYDAEGSSFDISTRSSRISS